MTVVLAVLIAAGILLAAPPDPVSRLRELLSGAREGRGRARRQRPRARDDEAERLWAIGAVENCAHLLKVGMTPQAVMATLSRQDDRLQPISRAIALGEEPGQAIASRGQSLPPAAAEVFAGMASVWTVSERSGAPAADMILRYAAARRDALDADRERRIAMAGPRATVRVLSWLPLIGMGLGLLIGVRPLDLVSGLPGQLSIGGGLVLYLLGRWWMRRMMMRAER
ncbi:MULTISPECIES: type II secretion system F family protein [Brevibacterium]|uniref:Type II secretion system protein GspF domain-containing protein n=2 Tax=Brevibacterium TaxID=1696 RepID=A0ABP9U332_9MICO